MISCTLVRVSYLSEANDSMGISCLQARQKTFPWAGSEGSSVPHAGQKFTSVSKAAMEGILMMARFFKLIDRFP